MKNKSKKILAGIGLALVGAGCLTGCSMSDEQKKALDLVTEKSDEIISLLEENMKYENTQLSKQEAYEMIVLSHSAFEFGFVNKVQIKETQKNYYGFFEDLRDTEINVIDYYLNGNIKYLNQTFVSEDPVSTYYLADHENNIYFRWNSKDDYEESLEENSPEVTVMGLSYYVNQLIDMTAFTADDIYNVEILEDGSWSFSIIIDREPYGETTKYDEKTLFKIDIKDNLIRKIDTYVYCTYTREAYEPTFATSEVFSIEFDYDAEMDFNVNEAKHAEALVDLNA